MMKCYQSSLWQHADAEMTHTHIQVDEDKNRRGQSMGSKILQFQVGGFLYLIL